MKEQTVNTQAQGDYPELTAAIKFVQDYDASVWKNPGDRHVADMVCATIIADLQRRIARLPPRSPQGDYPVLPEPWAKNGYAGIVYYTADQMRAYVEADRAARSGQVSDEPVATPVGEVVGMHKVGFKEMPTIYWTGGEVPEVGTKLYTRPGPSKEVVEALRHLDAAMDVRDGMADRMIHIHNARAALRSLGGEQK